MSDLDFDMEVQNKDEAETSIKSGFSGSGRSSRYEPIAEKYANLPDGKAIVISDMSQNDIQNLRNLLYRRFGKEEVIVRSKQQEDETYKAVVRDREGDEYLRDQDTSSNGESTSEEDVQEEASDDAEEEVEGVF